MADQTPLDLAKAMVDATLGIKADECGDKDGQLCHDAEVLASGFFSLYRLTFPSPVAMTPLDTSIYEMCRSLARQMIAVRAGNVNWDKIQDFGGWAVVGADAVMKGLDK